MMKLLLGLIALVLLAGGALLVAARINGPAVLDTLDKVTGGSTGVAFVGEDQYGPNPQQKLRIYAPVGAKGPLPVLVFVHGGSWSWGDPDDYGFVARALAPAGFVVALAGYRLGEEGRYPAMVEDTAAAIADVVRLAPAYGGDPERIVLVGHSAGAYNVVQAALDPQVLARAGVAPDHIRGVIGLSGPYDFYPFDKESSKAAFGSVGAGPDSQPVNLARADTPPMLLIHGERDTLVKPRNSRALAEALGKKGAQVTTRFYKEFDHNAPLISLASPWRRWRDVDAEIVSFARDVTKVSVPVQAGTS